VTADRLVFGADVRRVDLADAMKKLGRGQGTLCAHGERLERPQSLRVLAHEPGDAAPVPERASREEAAVGDG